MRRQMLGALAFLVLIALIAGRTRASGLEAFRMALVPEGPAVGDFPSGIDVVYAVFEYESFESEDVRVIVTDYAGRILFDETRTYAGSGIASIPITTQASVFPDGPYVTMLYFAGNYLSEAVEWTVGGVDSPPPPTPFPLARLEVEPQTLSFVAAQGGSNPAVQRVLITNNTGPTSIWQADANGWWLTLNPTGGETPALLKVGVEVDGLPAGTYNGHITISTTDAEDGVQTIAVDLNLATPEGTTVVDLPAVSTATGWVASDEPGNHFGEDEIWAGAHEGRQYLGGLQFDLSAVSDGSDIQAAALILTGSRWEVEAPGSNWHLEVLDPGLAGNWSAVEYAEVAGAVAVATLMPSLPGDDLEQGMSSVWVFGEGGLSALETALLDTDRVQLRLAGPEDEGLFVWEGTGILRVNYVPTAVPAIATPTSTPGAATLTPIPETPLPTQGSPTGMASPTATRRLPTMTASPTPTRVAPAVTPTNTPIAPPPPPNKVAIHKEAMFGWPASRLMVLLDMMASCYGALWAY